MHHDHEAAVCPIPNESGPGIQNIAGNMTWHSLSIIIAGATSIFAISTAIFLVFRHACRFSNPAEQKQIIRVISIIPTFAIISFLCVWQDGPPAPYIAPGRDVGEALAMAAFFLLMSTYVAPDERNRDTFFAEMAVPDKKGATQRGNGLTWYRNRTFGVIQWVPVSIILWIAAAISMAVGTFCATSNNIHFGHIWISIIRTLSTVIAITSILAFYKNYKSVLKSRGALKQLICFKLIVFLNFLQTLIFSFLNSSGDLHATKYFSYYDLSNGLPALLLCCEIALISPFFLVAYSVKPYILGKMASPENPSSRHDMQHYQGGPLGLYAILHALNLIDIITGLLDGLKAKVTSRSVQSRKYRYTAPGQTPLGYAGVRGRDSEDTAYTGVSISML